MTSAISVEDIKQWRGQDVIDPEGKKLGTLEEIMYDTGADLPAFAAVKSGLLGKRLTLVPLPGSMVGQSYLRVRIEKGNFKNAPTFDSGAELSANDEAEAYKFYGLEYGGDAQTARRLAKH